MAVEYGEGFCTPCNTRVRVERKGTNHLLHLLITVFTCGLWPVVWLLISIKFGGWHCPKCGSSDVRTKVKVPWLMLAAGALVALMAFLMRSR